MWSLSTDAGTPLVVEPRLDRLPAIYLDHDSLMGVTKTPDLRTRFLLALERGGTLLFSWAGALEVSGPQGADAVAVEGFLSEIGEHWLPLEMNVFRVARREAGEEPHDGHPCLSSSFVLSYVKERLYEVSPEGANVVSVDASLFNLGRVVAWTQRDRDEVRGQLADYKRETQGLIADLRARVAADKKSLDQLLPELPIAGTRPATALLHALLRTVVSRPGNEKWDPNDAVDLSRAVVAGACGDLIALDTTWKRRLLATGIEKARPGVRVFRRPELDQLIHEFEGRV
jgi:hypothetical protein